MRTYFIRMFMFLLCVGVVIFTLRGPLVIIFMNNAALNGLIAGALCFGIFLSFYNLRRLQHELAWLSCYDAGVENLSETPQPKILAPLALLLKENTNISSLPSMTIRSLLTSIEGRLEGYRDILRYLMGLLIFLGLLGTFWGLSQTIGAIATVIRGMNMGGSDFVQAFQDLKGGLQAPLTGMGTAFSCSLLGLSGSLIIGFLDLQGHKATTNFYHYIEERLTLVTRLSGEEGVTHSGPAYGLSLFERAVEGMNQLHTLIRRSEENRSSVVKGLQVLTEKISSLNEQLVMNQLLVKKVAENQLLLEKNLLQFSAALNAGNFGLDESFKQHLRNLDATSMRLLEEMVEGRNRLSTELRSEINLVAKTISALADGQEIAA